MENSGSEDDDFIVRKSLNTIPSIRLSVSEDPVTPPTDHSSKINKSLGLVTSPSSPFGYKFQTGSSRCRKKRLEVPVCCSTPIGTSLESRLCRSLKTQRSKGKDYLKERVSASLECLQSSSFVNPLSPSVLEFKQLKHLGIKSNKLNVDNESESSLQHHDLSQKSLKRLKLSDFDYPKFEQEFIVLGELGAGDHGCVFHCFSLLTGMEYAIKRSLKPINNEKLARKEIFAHATLEHHYIVSNYCSWTEDDYLFMQNEYCNGGNLEEHIAKSNGMMQEKDLTVLLEHMADGLRYMHECKLAHMDIKPSNIFLKIGWPKLTFKHNDHYSDFNDEDSKDDETTYKIGDLGHVISLDNRGDIEEGDCRYMPREILNDSHVDCTKVDIFSLGLTLYEAAGGGPLPKNGHEWHRVRDGQIKTFSHLSTKFNNLLVRMVDPDPKKRPSARDILSEFSRHESICRDLKNAHQKIQFLEHQLSGLVETVKSANAGRLKVKRAVNGRQLDQAMPVRATRSTCRLVHKKS